MASRVSVAQPMLTAMVGRLAEYGRLRTVLDADGPVAVAVVGESGVGKSRLLVELGVEAARIGWDVRWVYGSAALKAIPFAALLHAVGPVAQSSDPLELMAGARLALVGPGSGRTLLLVDDAHHLDEGSLGLIDQIVRHGDARVVIGTRGPSLWPEGLGVLVDRSLTVNIEVLDRELTTALVSELIDAQPSARLADEVWERTRGLPLFIVVLLEAAVAEGGFTSTDDGAEAPDGLPIAPLRELIETRITRAGDGVRRVVEFLAVGGPVPLSAFRALVPEDVLDSARRAGIVVEWDDAIEAAHPIYVEALGPASLERSSRLAAELFVALPDPVTALDRIRSALLAIDAGLSLDADQWSSAATDALERLDPLLAIRFARRAVAAEPGHVAARISLGKALAFVGDVDEAISVLQRINPRNDLERTSRATALAHALVFGAGQAEAAIQMLAAEAEHLDEAARLVLDNERALYAAVGGSFREVLAAGDRVLTSDRATPRVRLDAGVNVALARVMLGDLDRVDYLLDENDELARSLSSDRPLALLQNDLVRVAAEHGRGRLVEARRVVEDNIEQRLDPSWLQWTGILYDQEGRVLEAVTAQRAAIAAYERSDPFGLRTQAIGALGMHLGQMGTVRPVDVDLVRDADDTGRKEMRLAAWTGRGRAWVDCAVLGPEAGAVRALELGQWLMDHDHPLWGMSVLHDALRMGAAPSVVVESMAALHDTASSAGLLDTRRKHAVALDEDDLGLLGSVAAEFRQFGAIGLAREAWAQLASLAGQVGESAVAYKAAARSQLLEVHTPHLRTPGLSLDIHGLSRREFDVVERVLQGHSNREIAAILFLSVRTVENHLHAVYRKLGLSGREDLVAELTV